MEMKPGLYVDGKHVYKTPMPVQAAPVDKPKKAARKSTKKKTGKKKGK